MKKILSEGRKSDNVRFCIGFITGRGIVKDKSTIVLKASAPEVALLNKLFDWLGIADISIFTDIGPDHIMLIRSSTLIKYLHDLLQKEGNSTVIWGKRIREWGEWPDNSIASNDSHFVRGYMAGVHPERAADTKNPKNKEFEMTVVV